MAQKPRRKPPFVRETRTLQPDHGWKASEGYNVCVIERGAIRFEYPKTWVHEAKENSLKFHDVPYPNDTIVMEISVLHSPPMTPEVNIDPALLVLKSTLERRKNVDPETLIVRDLPGLRVAWIDCPDVDPDNGKPLIWRQIQCRPDFGYTGPGLYAIITYGFYIEVQEIADRIWNHIVTTIVMGQYIADPTRGPVLN